MDLTIRFLGPARPIAAAAVAGNVDTGVTTRAGRLLDLAETTRWRSSAADWQRPFNGISNKFRFPRRDRGSGNGSLSRLASM